MNDLVMTIPDYQSIMLPLLPLMADQQEHSKPDAVEHLSKAFKLTQSERDELLPSGRQSQRISKHIRAKMPRPNSAIAVVGTSLEQLVAAASRMGSLAILDC